MNRECFFHYFFCCVLGLWEPPLKSHRFPLFSLSHLAFTRRSWLLLLFKKYRIQSSGRSTRFAYTFTIWLFVPEKRKLSMDRLLKRSVNILHFPANSWNREFFSHLYHIHICSISSSLHTIALHYKKYICSKICVEGVWIYLQRGKTNEDNLWMWIRKERWKGREQPYFSRKSKIHRMNLFVNKIEENKLPDSFGTLGSPGMHRFCMNVIINAENVLTNNIRMEIELHTQGKKFLWMLWCRLFLVWDYHNCHRHLFHGHGESKTYIRMEKYLHLKLSYSKSV